MTYYGIIVCYNINRSQAQDHNEWGIQQSKGGMIVGRTHYDVRVWFTYSNGLHGGLLDTPVNSFRGIFTQMTANLDWLRIKGHRAMRVEIKPISRKEKRHG